MLALAIIVFGTMLVEALRAARNERAQRDRGGREPPDDVYHVMRWAYPAAFGAMLLEARVGRSFGLSGPFGLVGIGALRGGVPPVVFAAGAALFVLGKALKWWAILTLGSAWTFRVIVVPGASLVTTGPYRFLRHPNYVGVVGELVGVALMTGAVVSGSLGVVGFGALIKKRIAVEERALAAGGSATGSRV